MNISEIELFSKQDIIMDENNCPIDCIVTSEKLSIIFTRDMKVDTIVEVLEEALRMYKERKF
jgi:hypothetical protein